MKSRPTNQPTDRRTLGLIGKLHFQKYTTLYNLPIPKKEVNNLHLFFSVVFIFCFVRWSTGICSGRGGGVSPPSIKPSEFPPLRAMVHHHHSPQQAIAISSRPNPKTKEQWTSKPNWNHLIVNQFDWHWYWERGRGREMKGGRERERGGLMLERWLGGGTCNLWLEFQNKSKRSFPVMDQL